MDCLERCQNLIHHKASPPGKGKRKVKYTGTPEQKAPFPGGGGRQLEVSGGWDRSPGRASGQPCWSGVLCSAHRLPPPPAMAAAASSSSASSSPSSEGATPRCRGQHHFLPDDMWLAILSFLRAPQWALVPQSRPASDRPVPAIFAACLMGRGARLRVSVMLSVMVKQIFSSWINRSVGGSRIAISPATKD